jgi:phosphonate metabolism-associated iron-containing alcohol dehydrogenase
VWTYHNPVHISVGRNSLDQLPALLARRSCLLVTFPEAESLGLVRRMRQLLGAQLRGVIDSIAPNPDVQWLAPLYGQVQRDHAEVPVIVALGGGSAIDSAKALICHTPSGRFADLLALLKHGGQLEAGGHKALIAIPTTAGPGSEVTPWATIWDQAAGQKYSLHQSCTWPEAAVIDAELMTSLPAGSTLASGLDALSHALESIWNVNRNPVSMALAVQSARRTLATLPALMQDLGSAQLRNEMAEAALMAGLAFSNTKTALAHSLSYDITLQHGVPHGLACSFSLPLVLEMALWTTPRGRRAFGMSVEKAELTKVLAANQGLYNGFLVAGLAWGLWLGAGGFQIKVFFLVCVLVAGLYGAATVSRKILLVQAIPAALALIALALRI